MFVFSSKQESLMNWLQLFLEWSTKYWEKPAHGLHT